MLVQHRWGYVKRRAGYPGQRGQRGQPPPSESRRKEDPQEPSSEHQGYEQAKRKAEKPER